MIEKACNPARQIDRDELMPRPRREPAFEKVSRGHRSGGNENLERRSRLQQPLDQCQYRGGLANARGVDPQQRPLWPDGTRNSAALTKPIRVLLALPAPSIQIDDRQGRKRPGRRVIKERKHQSPAIGRAGVLVSLASNGGDVSWPTRRSASATISTMRVSRSRRAVSRPSSSSSAAISIGSPNK